MTDLVPTPGQTIGPFFKDAMAYPHGGEMVVPGSAGAVWLRGAVYDGAGAPVPDALLEIRQADAAGNVPQVEGSLCRDGTFTGWGRSATDADGRYRFLTVEPGPVDGAAAFFAVTVFARGLLDRLFTRVYLPDSSDPFLDRLDAARRSTLLARRETDGSLRFDIHLQGERETVFLHHPRDNA
jgi:protocatechuate 3,4-dioxygenase alpha subunit